MIVPTGERPVPPPKLQEIDDLLIRTVQEKRIVEENERLRRQVPFRCHLRERSHDIDVVVVGRCSSSTSGRSRPCRRRSGTWRSANISPSSSAGRRATRPTSTRPTGTCRSASIRPSTSRARPARATGTPIPSFRPTGRSVAVPFFWCSFANFSMKKDNKKEPIIIELGQEMASTAPNFTEKPAITITWQHCCIIA